MTLELKLVILFFIIIAVIRYGRSQPDKLLSRVLFNWHGPFPYEGEVESQFAIRWAKYSFKWFVTILSLLLLGGWLLYGQFKVYENQYLQATFFALALLMSMACAASLGFLIKAGCLHFGGYKKVFDSSVGGFR